jgi:3-oxoadipate enol-lactonase
VSRTRFATSGDVRIAYELRGAAVTRRPFLVLIQGLGFDRTGWGPAIRRLQRSFRLVLIDNRGSGRSAGAAGSFSVHDMCRDVVQVLDDVGIETAHVMGASLGGMVAQDLAIRQPGRVDRLVLACTTPGWPFAYPMPMSSLRLMTGSRRLPSDMALRLVVENALSATTVAERPELVDRILAHQRAAGADPEAWHVQATAGARYVGSVRQRAIVARTLILHGAADRVVDPRNARLLASRISGAELVMFPGLGHLLFWEDPPAFAAAVAAFLLDGDGDAAAGPVRAFAGSPDGRA